jgi:hypothetical protein
MPGKMPSIIIEEGLRTGDAGAEFLGIFSVSRDEQIAQKIYEATGDKVFKGFLPLSWKTALIVRMRDTQETLTATLKRKPTAAEMSWKIPEVSQRAHDYFLRNADKINPLLPTPDDLYKKLKPVFWIAGIAAAAYLLAQVKTFVPKRRENE